MVTVSRLEKTLGDIWTRLNITIPVSWLSLAKRYIKLNKIVACCYNIENWLQASLLSSSAYFKSDIYIYTSSTCPDVTRTIESFTGLIEDQTDSDSSFFLLCELKCKTFSTNKEETSIMILKSVIK